MNAADKYGSTPLHVMVACLKRSASELQLSKEDWNYWPLRFSTTRPLLTMDLIRMLVSTGGNIYAVNSKNHTTLSMVRGADLKHDMVFLTRRPLLHFFEAVSFADDLPNNPSLLRVAANNDLIGYIVGFL